MSDFIFGPRESTDYIQCSHDGHVGDRYYHCAAPALLGGDECATCLIVRMRTAKPSRPAPPRPFTYGWQRETA